MKNYMQRILHLAIFVLIAVTGITVVTYTTQTKFDRLRADLTNSVSTIGDFKAAMRDKERRMQCMTQNVYWEAASEPAEGKIAVAQVVMNRVVSFLQILAKWCIKRTWCMNEYCASFPGTARTPAKLDQCTKSSGPRVKRL